MRRTRAEKTETQLNQLLQHPSNSVEFEKFLRKRGELASLEFIWALNGLRSLMKSGETEGCKIVGCIYRRFIVSGKLHYISSKTLLSTISTLLEMTEDQRNKNKREVKKEQEHLKILEEMEKEVVHFLGNEMIPRFKSKERQRGNEEILNCVNGHDGLSLTFLPRPVHHKYSALPKLSPEEFMEVLTPKLEALYVPPSAQNAENNTDVNVDIKKQPKAESHLNNKRFLSLKSAIKLCSGMNGSNEDHVEVIPLLE